ncbi:MAG: amidohydrolase [Phycisphaerales bacterium]
MFLAQCLASFVFALAVAPAVAQPAATVYVNANIYTMDPNRPRAAAMAVVGDHIIAVGLDADIRAMADPGVTVIDLKGRTVLPGLIDAHGHMANLGALRMGMLDLTLTKSYDEVVAAVVARVKAAKPGEWILGRGWDHESWPSRELPTHHDLSRAAPDNPVWLRRVDGHAAVGNRKAMEAAGVTKDTPDPAGGEVMRDGAGEPTGVFVDVAEDLIDNAVPASARGNTQDMILKAQELCLAAGLTGVHDAGIHPAVVELYERLAESGRLKLRVYAMVSGPHAMKWFEAHEPIIGERFTCRAAKLYIDGAMGSRGAWLLEPYADRPTGPDGLPYRGLAVAETAFIDAVVKHALKRGYQVCTHAIGDRGSRTVLNAYERANRARLPDLSFLEAHREIEARRAQGQFVDEEGRRRILNGLPRFRIEHAQLLSPRDITRFAPLNVIASMQPTHCTSDMRWVEARVGGVRAKGAYAWASLLRAGVRIAAGSDFPVESHNPFLGFYAAVTRQNTDGEPVGGWMPQERITRDEALRAFTLDAAYAAFEEDRKGSLAPGKYADFVVIDRDVMTCDEKDIPGTRVLMTVIGGETVFTGDAGG